MEEQDKTKDIVQEESGYDEKAGVSAEFRKKVADGIETPPELEGRYRFVCRIGHGSQGNVFKAIRCSDELAVAIKVLEIDSVQNWKDYELFHRESEVLQSLNMNGIAKFYESLEFLEQKHPRAYIVQEYIEGRSLAEMIRSGYRFTINRVFEIALDLVTLLEKLHHHDPPVIHRDLKPANIMCRRSTERDYDVYLIDFGAVANPQVQGGGSTIAGTCGYMPPEQLLGRPEAASDIYALGATLVYMLSGVDPGEIQISDFRLIIEPHLEQIPPGVVSILRQMLEPMVDRRLYDYDKLKQIFSDFSKNQYHYQLESLPAPKDVTEQLHSVKSYGQPGNIALWAALSDKTPRKLNFKVNELRQTNLISSHSIHRGIGKKSGIRPSNKGASKSSKEFFVVCMIVFGLITIICIGVAVNTYTELKKRYDTEESCMNRYNVIMARGGLNVTHTLDDIPCDRICAAEQLNNCYHAASFSRKSEKKQKKCKKEYENTLRTGTMKRMQEHVEQCDESCAKAIYSSCIENLETSGLKSALRVEYSFDKMGPLYILFFIGVLIAFAGGAVTFISSVSGSGRKKIGRAKFTSGDDYKELKNLLINGRKSIGIITDIKYIPMYTNDSEHYLYMDGEREKSGWYCHHLPVFELSYKFNPIDDASPDDLVHKVIIHEPPGEILKAGNPIPILYLIDEHDNSRVWSMPYPFPMETIVTLKDLYY